MRQAQLYPLASPFLPPVSKVEKDYSYANGHMIGTLEAGGDAGLPKTGQTGSQRTGDDGDLEKGLPETGDRWTDNEDGTATDNVTGLVYINDFSQLSSPFYSGGTQQKMSWNDAIDNCLSLSFAGKSDWRLANIWELVVLSDFDSSYPGFDDAVFSMASNDYYWSSTTPYNENTKAMICFWTFRLTVQGHVKTNSEYCMPVRGPD